MLSAIGQCVALITHAQAVFRGEATVLDWSANPWFAHTADYQFGVGEPGGPSQGDDPNAWFTVLRAAGFTGASLFIEPFDGTWTPIMHAGIAGGLRLAPVTSSPDDEIIWHERPRFDQDKRMWHVYRGGFRLAPNTPRVRATKSDAAVQLDAALERMVDFQRARRPEEPQWSEMFEAGRRILQDAGLAPSSIPAAAPQTVILERVRPLFPASYDSAAFALVAAVEAAWALGGMGWWNDWDTRAEGFAEVTFAYYEALLAALASACEETSA